MSDAAAPWPTIVLKDVAAGSEAEVIPHRGGMVTRFSVRGEPVLTMDDSSLFDATRNVRGGIPVLFPTAGRLADDAYVKDGTRFEMKQHGFARNLAWDVAGGSSGSSVTLALESSAETRRSFPFEFRVEITYELRGNTLGLLQAYENRSGEPMPLHAGFHPYFFVPGAEKADTVIETNATRAFDNVTKSEVPFRGFDLTRPEVDLHLLDHGGHRGVLARPGRQRIEIDASPEFTHWVVWTLAGKDFVCLEPWTAPGNALNTGERLLSIAPGETRRLTVRIAA